MSVLDKGVQARPNGVAPARRSFSALSRVSREQRLALAAGLVATVLAMSMLRDRRATVEVAVAAEPIPAAAALSAGMVRPLEIPADSPLAESLARFDGLTTRGLVTTRAVAEGEPLTGAALVADVPDDGLRAMSVPVPQEHAAGGALRPGDRVDVIDIIENQPEYVVTNAEVLAVSEEEAGSVGSRPTAYTITLAVDATAGLRLAGALADGELEVLRSTGAAPIATGSAFPNGGNVG